MAFRNPEHIPPPLRGDPLRTEGVFHLHHTLLVASTGDTRDARRAGANTAP